MSGNEIERMEKIHGRLEKTAGEVERIRRGENAQRTVIDGKPFDNLEWVLAEHKAAQDEASRVMTVVTPEGKVPYEEGFSDL